MGSTGWQIGISIAWATIYILFAFSTRQRELESRITRALLAYAFLAAVWEFAWASAMLGWLSFLGEGVLTWLRPIGVLALSLIFLIMSWYFLQIDFSYRRGIGFGIGAALLIFCILLWINPFKLDEVVQLGSILFSIFVGWLVVILDTMVITISTYRKIHKPQHRNRIVYWGVSLGVIVIGDLLLLTGFILPGSTIHMVGTLLAGYVILVHEAVDLVRGIIRLVSYAVTTLFGAVIYYAILKLELRNLGVEFFQNQQVILTVKALFLVILVNPALAFLYTRVDRIIFGKGYAPSEVLREYGLRVSNLADLHQLAREALGFIDQTFHAEFGHLYLVDEASGDNGYVLKPVIPDETADPGLQAGRISAVNPVIQHVLATKRPFTQYDLDFLPRFRSIPYEEKQWLSSLQADVFIPICTKDDWIGLLVLGPKKSGNRYFSEELDLLTALADQTVAALQNTRLVTDLQEASRALEIANQRLRELDEMKSAFIGVITHEMRTPLANIVFAMQILEKYGTNNLTAEQLKQLVQVSKGVKAARNMIDNLILHASFLNNQVVLKTEKFDFRELVAQVVEPMLKAANEKDLRVTVDVPEEGLLVVADRALLSVALYHLIDNAIKFTDVGGKIWIGAWEDPEAVWLDVRDTGRGIAPDKVDLIWQSFAQASSDSLRRGLEGLGLGLSLVKFIIQAHGGQVGVESQPGAGSIFRFRIPARGPDFPLSAEVNELFLSPILGQDLPSVI